MRNHRQANLLNKTSSYPGPGSQVYATAGSYNFTVPTGVTSIVIKLWGGGATGGSGTYAIGGVGGSFAQKTLSVTPNTSVGITVAAQVVGTAASSFAGNNSYAVYNSVTVCQAKGGSNAASNIGDIIYTGGTGGSAANPYSGSGGGGASSSGNGGNGNIGSGGNGAAGGVGGAGTPTGGAGGAGKYQITGAGIAGTAPGGAAGGRIVATYATGTGAAGRAEISW